MRIDLHIHTRTGSDGILTLEEVFREAKVRKIKLMSITDHDSLECQKRAISLARENGIDYITGIELNVSFEYPGREPVSLDFLGYRFDPDNRDLRDKLTVLKAHREARARQILVKLNVELRKESLPELTEADLQNIQSNVDGVFGRPHIANYLVKKGIVGSRQEAFDRYLMKCDVPKYPLSLAEASSLIRGAGGLLVLAHANDPNGTSLVTLTRDLGEQTRIVEQYMLRDIDGIECWHHRHGKRTVRHYLAFARRHGLIMTGGSDCHQQPLIMGSLDLPRWVADQFQRAGSQNGEVQSVQA